MTARSIAKEPIQGDALVRRYRSQTKRVNAIRVVIRCDPDRIWYVSQAGTLHHCSPKVWRAWAEVLSRAESPEQDVVRVVDRYKERLP